MNAREAAPGPPLFSYGFRPFFLAATLFALGVVPAWWLIWSGVIPPGGQFAPTDWHVHEMIFGYGAAVVAGFLFTAVPNWTGRLPTRGWPLAGLLAVWIAGRVAMAGTAGLGPVGVLLVDQAFLLAVVAMIAREIVAGRNWRNLKVLVPVTLLWAANILFHVEALAQGRADYGYRLGIALLIFLIMLIGGRIIPSFTRNWLAQQGGARLPVPFGRFDGVSILVGAAALVSWVLVPNSGICAILSALAGVLHLIRLARWRGYLTLRSPLLLMLHLAYGFVPLGFACLAAGAVGWLGGAAGAHVFGIGAIGGMTVAVMMRATMGHTGRSLVAGPGLSAAFACIVAAALIRSAGQTLSFGSVDAIAVSAGLWTAAFALLAWRIGPWLWQPNAARRAPSRP